VKRYSSVLRLREGAEEKYERHHAAVWPEVLAIIRQGGARNYSIYRYGRWLFSYFEAADDFSPEAFGALYMANETCRRWEALMQTLQEPLPESGEGGWWVAMKEVFHAD